MLIQFTVKNFRSIKGEQVLSMVTGPGDEVADNLISHFAMGKDKLSKSSVIYGANASGKTNLIMAISYLTNIVRHSAKFKKDEPISHYEPFAFDKKTLNAPVKFEAVFIANNTKYLYGISFLKLEIREEYLYYYPKNKKRLIFKREFDGSYKIPRQKSLSQKIVQELELKNSLLLSYVSNLKSLSNAWPALEWFTKKMFNFGPTVDVPNIQRYTANALLGNPKIEETLLSFLKSSDIKISAIEIKRHEMDKVFSDFPASIKDFSQKWDIKFVRKIKGNFYKLDFEEESEGTRQMFALFAPIAQALNFGEVLLIDEISSKLHYSLTEFILRIFNHPKINSRNAQLIFSTHNTNLLSKNVFRRDQIWFTEKNRKDMATHLYSLLEYSPRKNENIQKGYLAGRYGAIPFIGDMDIFK